mmetsp:Transcript_87904/g.243893  ORF Transcript_87904/g.243893 Transcript_87904/m.243893 type:complete len:260 (+) Transcript_87904:1922-2701(+)
MLRVLAHEAGKSGPGSPTMKSLLKKRSFLLIRTFASSSTKACSFCMYEAEVSGDTNRSPSSRLSDRWGLKTSRNKAASLKPGVFSLAPPMRDQNSLPRMGKGASPSSISTASFRLNLSKLRSTPLGPGCRADRGSVQVRAIRPAIGAAAAVTRAVSPACTGKARAAAMRKRSRPKATPPYTLWPLTKTPSGLPRAAPLWSRTWEWKRSLQSWGISSEHFAVASFTAVQSTVSNHAASKVTWASKRNFASTEALANSRRW